MIKMYEFGYICYCARTPEFNRYTTTRCNEITFMQLLRDEIGDMTFSSLTVKRMC